MRLLHLFLFTCLLSYNCIAQSIDFQNQNSIANDSTYFKEIQTKLEGCWKNKFFNFKYIKSTNFGCEFKSKIRSSAPCFNLILLNDKVYIQWLELTGGEILQQIKFIDDKKLLLLDEDKKKIKYKRNSNCESNF